MFKLFLKTVTRTESAQDFDTWQQQKNAITKGLLRDFPWLWAIQSHWDNDPRTKVSQDISDLKLILAQPSNKTRFSVWAVTSQPCTVFNMRVTCLNPTEGQMWAEMVMLQTNIMSEIIYLVMVDPIYGEQNLVRSLIIFRNPTKKPINKLIEHV